LNADLSVQSENVSRKSEEANTEHPSEDSSNRRRSNVLHRLAQLGNDVVNHFASTNILVRGLDVRFAFHGFFVKVFANFRNSVVVVVVSIVVVVVSIVVVVVA